MADVVAGPVLEAGMVYVIDPCDMSAILLTLLLYPHTVLVIVVILSPVQEGELGIGELLFLGDGLEFRAISCHEFGQFVDDGPRLSICEYWYGALVLLD